MTGGSLVFPKRNSSLVLDAWPLLEWFRGSNPDLTTKFRALLQDAAEGRCALSISRINLGEIYYMTAKTFGRTAAEGLVSQMPTMFIEVVSVSNADVDAAAVLKSQFAISYADAFAAHLSIQRHAPLVTGDRDFEALVAAGVLQMQWVGR